MIARLRLILTGSLIAATTIGCGSVVRLDAPSIPVPLIDSMPMTVAVRLPPNFENFVHEEEVLGREQWRIDLGRSNAAFFTQLLGYMFDDIVMLSDTDDPAVIAFDALIEPSIDAFEFSVPNQTKTDSFAVWIRYRIKVYDREGTLVLNSPFSAYGKSLTTTMGGSDALQRAAVLAMRDAAALLIIKFDSETLFASLADPEVKLPEVADETENDGAAVQTSAVGGGQSDD